MEFETTRFEVRDMNGEVLAERREANLAVKIGKAHARTKVGVSVVRVQRVGNIVRERLVESFA